jgi:tetrahydromethanopterin S-methyltransferase subunit G
MPISEDRADRIEQKLEEIKAALTQMARIDERQIEAGRRIGHLENEVTTLKAEKAALEKKVDSWVNRGIGVWGLVVVLFAVYQAFAPVIHKGP